MASQKAAWMARRDSGFVVENSAVKRDASTAIFLDKAIYERLSE
jgi:hypothetical protein